ncbi:MAG: archaeosortase/exosortase family protein [Verrucomicrobia bacterium]|nr:archaeosortase/exosortase family protein [Verrucomicrobiota bacterium]
MLWAGIALFVVWALTNMERIGSDEDALIRVVLISLFALLILLRPKPEREAHPDAQAFRVPGLHGNLLPLGVGIGGALLSLAGTILTVYQFEWLGIIMLLYACLRWSLPAKYRRDVIIAIFLLYWMHPIPGRVFGAFQLWMQLLSVQGAEALLYCLNVPVWAEGFYLRTGVLTLGLPEACSGMRTVVTVSLCTLGLSALFRLRWIASLFLLLAGVVQVLAFNILRVAAVVIMAPRMPREWAGTVLHDTLGFFLLFTILVVQLEVSGYKMLRDKRRRLKDGIAEGRLERPVRSRALPGPWRLVRAIWKPVLVLGVVGLVSAYGVYKQRSGHRLNMMRPVIDLLLESEIETADTAIVDALTIAPEDRDLMAKRAHVLLVKQDYVGTLAAIEALPPPLSVVEVVMHSRALMSLGRIDEAFKETKALSDRAGNRPGIAMIMAEYAAVKDLPADVNRNILIATRSHLVQARVRSLFPYLAVREQWQTIVECDNPNVGYVEVGPALVAVQAHLRTRDVMRAAEIMNEVAADNPCDPRCLSSLFTLALSQRDGEWETLFAANLMENMSHLSADRLAASIDHAFRLDRPDLAWMAWRHLEQRDPTDPSLYLVLARFHDIWFMFRRHSLSIKAQSDDQQIDLRTLYKATADLAPFKALWGRVPEAAEVAALHGRVGRMRYLKQFFAEINRRAAAGTLTERMEMAVAPALGLAGKHDAALAKLFEVEAKYPAQKSDILYQRAVIYYQNKDWQALYETLVAYRALPNYQSRLGAELMFINTMMNLNLGAASLHVAEQARLTYPGSRRVEMALAAIWDAFRYKGQALFILKRTGDPDPRAVVQLLYDTGRTHEAERMSSALSVGITRHPAGEQQALFLPPAQLALARRWPAKLDAAGFVSEAAEYEAEIKKSSSAFIIALRTMARDWCRARGEGAVSDLAAWRAIARNELETIGSLHQLAMLLARQERYGEAAKAVAAALELSPQSVVLRRIHMVLAEDRDAAVTAARTQCPDDPAIWLASLMQSFQHEGKGAWADEMIKQAVAERRFACETFTRAGDFLLRAGMPTAAAAAARHAIDEAQSLVPPYVLGVRCGMLLREYDWALSCALRGAELAQDPTPFFKTVVTLKWARDSRDNDIVKALQYLQQHDPEQDEWAERLGLVYFEKRDSRRALSVLSAEIDKRGAKMRMQSLLMAAEAARMQGNHAKAVEVLELAYSLYPARVNVLNNLVYALSERPATMKRAEALLPKLVALGKESFPVLDTAAMVYLRAGQVERARDLMERAMTLMEPGHYSALEMTLNAAEIYMLSGKWDEAETHLNAVWEFHDRSSDIDNRAKALLKKLKNRRWQ